MKKGSQIILNADTGYNYFVTSKMNDFFIGDIIKISGKAYKPSQQAIKDSLIIKNIAILKIYPLIYMLMIMIYIRQELCLYKNL
jgi:hypothetical protein